MGQKVHPTSLRVGYIMDWKSVWFGERDFAEKLNEDIKIREHISEKLAHAGLSDIIIRKSTSDVTVDINTARPGIVIGKSGSEVDALRKELHDITGKQVKVNILEVKRPELDAKLVAQSIAEQLQGRVAYRRAMKRALTSAIRSGAKGVRIQVSGRLGGAEMARRQSYSDGSVPLHTMRAEIDYGFCEAKTTAGRIGVKCWINKGEVMPEGFSDEPTESKASSGKKKREREGKAPKDKADKKFTGGGKHGKKDTDKKDKKEAAAEVKVEEKKDKKDEKDEKDKKDKKDKKEAAAEVKVEEKKDKKDEKDEKDKKDGKEAAAEVKVEDEAGKEEGEQ